MITLAQILLPELQAHGSRAYPDECCGAMFGSRSGETKHCTHLEPLDNHSPENRRRRFAVTTEDYQRMEAYAATHHLTLLGFYHSHPDHPPRPSETDLKFAWPFFSYLIMNVEKGVPGPIHSYELDLDTHQFREESLNWIS